MFIIQPDTPDMWPEALLILSYYHINGTMYSNGENTDGMFMVVSSPVEVFANGQTDDQESLAEMAFQMNWHQKGKMCPWCKDNDPNNDGICGHLTFNKPIKPAF